MINFLESGRVASRAGSYMDAPVAKRLSVPVEAGRDCSHTFGLDERRLAAGPDGISWLSLIKWVCIAEETS